MAAASYYQGNFDQSREHLVAYPQNTAYLLKPMPATSAYSLNSSTPSAGKYDYSYVPGPDEQLAVFERSDSRLKYRIRVLKLIARVLAAILSLCTFAPLLMTLIKFFATKGVFKEVNGQLRTAWAHDTITWYTYMYFGIALVSLVLNSAIMVAYMRSVRHANRTATVASVFSTAVLVGHIIVWAVSSALYRYGKEPVGGKFRDLWGWTCSPAAQKVQEVFKEQINFDQYCNVQSFSWYSGLAQVGAAVLSALIYFLAIRRVKSKKAIQRFSTRASDAAEPMRR